MDTALYYTFSTIAQALAGAIAFLAAVVLFKLQGIDSELKELADVIEDAFGVGNELISEHYTQGHWDEMLSAIPAGAFNDDIRRRVACSRVRALLQAREKLVAALKLSVPLTLGVIIAAVIVLPFAPRLNESVCLSLLFLGAGVAAFTGCIVSYWRVITALWRP